MTIRRILLSLSLALGGLVSFSAPAFAYDDHHGHGHQVCHYDHHHHRSCHWVH